MPRMGDSAQGSPRKESGRQKQGQIDSGGGPGAVQRLHMDEQGSAAWGSVQVTQMTHNREVGDCSCGPTSPPEELAELTESRDRRVSSLLRSSLHCPRYRMRQAVSAWEKDVCIYAAGMKYSKEAHALGHPKLFPAHALVNCAWAIPPILQTGKMRHKFLHQGKCKAGKQTLSATPPSPTPPPGPWASLSGHSKDMGTAASRLSHKLQGSYCSETEGTSGSHSSCSQHRPGACSSGQQPAQGDMPSFQTSLQRLKQAGLSNRCLWCLPAHCRLQSSTLWAAEAEDSLLQKDAKLSP